MEKTSPLDSSTSRLVCNNFIQVTHSEFLQDNIQGDSITVKKGSCDLTVGEIVQELCFHLRPSLASTIKEVLNENISSINSTKTTDSSTVGATSSNDPHASSFVNYGVDEEMNEMKKILDNPWNPDETIDLPRLQIETMDSWKKNFGRLNKVFEDKKGEDSWDTHQNFGAVVSTISTSNSNATSHHSPVQAEHKAISVPKKGQAIVKPRKLFRVCIFSVIVIIILVIAVMIAVVILELDFYGGHTASARQDIIWLKLRRRPQFFLSSNIL